MQNFVSLQFYNYGNAQSYWFYTFHKGGNLPPIGLEEFYKSRKLKYFKETF